MHTTRVGAAATASGEAAHGLHEHERQRTCAGASASAVGSASSQGGGLGRPGALRVRVSVPLRLREMRQELDKAGLQSLRVRVPGDGNCGYCGH